MSILSLIIGWALFGALNLTPKAKGKRGRKTLATNPRQRRIILRDLLNAWGEDSENVSEVLVPEYVKDDHGRMIPSGNPATWKTDGTAETVADAFQTDFADLGLEMTAAVTVHPDVENLPDDSLNSEGEAYVVWLIPASLVEYDDEGNPTGGEAIDRISAQTKAAAVDTEDVVSDLSDDILAAFKRPESEDVAA